MSTVDLSSLLTLAIEASKAASVEIMTVYESGDFQTETKGDQSPLTQADRRAHQAITSILEKAQLPILSEEGKTIPYEERKNWPYFWMVDPLDGTKEFVKRNGEFTVNIALIQDQHPVLGVVAVPVSGDIFYAIANKDAYVVRNAETHLLPKRRRVDFAQPALRVVASRSHRDEQTEDFISKLVDPTLLSKGSSLKFMLLAEGSADVYPRFAPTMEWDTAAAHAIINAVGMRINQQGKSEQLSYNKPSLLNPFFLAF
ncbi:3'(2'),5'-bisphosphate nucleotidase CysQ [Pseudochryseolinea flava]|uniref:3'(2'),5'-bisphosphate nucleotidase CysQ n=1 Tax=Pseudochryseolinea flava TaxID=2059302 RepID=A0A364Y5G9_9BACT|nr:3'(2'),5'-bisphosphate nucleotidase CysQ [Pseudochryseolinea flava]RAW01311.1 3'(2'),5'-bisphosphate nucleotidase [Pseudochryseolinea flava]